MGQNAPQTTMDGALPVSALMGRHVAGATILIHGNLTATLTCGLERAPFKRTEYSTKRGRGLVLRQYATTEAFFVL